MPKFVHACRKFAMEEGSESELEASEEEFEGLSLPAVAQVQSLLLTALHRMSGFYKMKNASEG